jgi:hypothetical protein
MSEREWSYRGLVIEKGVAGPVRWSRGLSLVLRQMAVGDSVLVPEGKGRSVSNQVARLRRRMAADGETRHWTVRTVEGGARVWRDQ